MSDNAVIAPAAAPISQINLLGVLRIPAVRQVMLLVGVAASVAVGFAVVLWSQTPGYAKLYSELDTAEAAQIAEALRGAGIKYKLDTDVGLVMVADSQLDQARLELASQGLPQGGGTGMDMLQGQSSFGVSQFMESARYQDMLETELARTISHLGAVRNARVHLAIPRQSSFIRDRNTASASVLLELNRGRELEPDQASAIVHLVASSIPNLPAGNVTLVDQLGRLLSTPGGEQMGAQVGNQFRYTQTLEESYKRRIEDLLTPLVGPGRVRAEVVASLDFTITEETRESFDPEQTVVRSEQINEEEMRDASRLAQGVPGATSNQPPETGANAEPASDSADAEPVNRTRSSTRNFEVDRTISRVLPQPGRIQRLSVAILIDDSPGAEATEAAGAAGADGSAGPATLTDADVAELTALAREAVGFEESRGDTLVVTRKAFRELPEALPMEAPAIWENPIVMDIAKLLLGATVALALGFGLVRPMFKGLMASAGEGSYALAGPGMMLPPGSAQAGGGQYSLGAPSFDDKVTAAKNITNHDPARVAQIVRKWISENG